MKIRVDLQGNMVLLWEYQIKKQKKEVDDVVYHHYSASFPKALKEFWDTDYIYLRKEEGVVFLSPNEEEGAKKIRISSNGNRGYLFSLPKRVLSSLDEGDFVRLSFDGSVCCVTLF